MEIFIVILLFAVLAALLLKFKQPSSSVEMQNLFVTQFESFSRQIDDRINYHFKVQSSSENRIKESLDEAKKSYKDVENRLTNLLEVSSKIYEVGKDVSSLNELLKSPKLRGGLGEFFLEDLIKQVIPAENYDFQYTFKGGEKVDAVVKLAEKVVCIDSKFPLENYIKLKDSNIDTKDKMFTAFIRDVKKHVDSIAEKYIKPSLGTFDFALMYIPAESVYYEIILSNETTSLFDYCYGKKVIPVSPNNLFIYLQTILIGLKGFQIEQNAKKISQNLSQIAVDFNNFELEFNTLGTHLSNASNKFDSSQLKLAKIDQRLESIAIEDSASLELDK